MMAERSSVEWEKRGNTWWVQCACDTWFPVSEEMVRHRSVKLRCPKCGSVFAAPEAAAISEP